MKSVLAQVQDTDYVLKGGTALLLTRDLDRHSTDLDFDASRKINLEKRIEEGIKSAGVELVGIKAVKDTDTVQRFKAHYINPENGKDTLLKIETSFRNAPDQEMLEIVNNIKTYKVEHIFDQKLVAAENRTKPRDLYDLAHLVEKHGDKLSDKQISKVESFSSDMTKLEQIYEKSFGADPVLSSQTAEDTILRLREAIEVQLEDRSLTLSDGQQKTNYSELNTEDTKMDDHNLSDQDTVMDEETWDNMSDQEREEYEADNYLRNQAENEITDNPEQLESNIARMEAEGITEVEEQANAINQLVEQYKESMLELQGRIADVSARERPELQSAFADLLKQSQPVLNQVDDFKLSKEEQTITGLYNIDKLSIVTEDTQAVIEAMPNIVDESGLDRAELAERFVLGADNLYLENTWVKQDLDTIVRTQGLDLNEPTDFETARSQLTDLHANIEETLVNHGWYDSSIVAEDTMSLDDLRTGVFAQFDGESDKYTMFEPVIAYESGDIEKLALALIELHDNAKSGKLSDEQLDIMNASMPTLMADRYEELDGALSRMGDPDSEGTREEEISLQAYVEKARFQLSEYALSLGVDTELKADTRLDKHEGVFEKIETTLGMQQAIKDEEYEGETH